MEDIQKQVLQDLDQIPTHDYESDEDYLSEEEELESDPAPVPHKKPQPPSPKRDRLSQALNRDIAAVSSDITDKTKRVKFNGKLT